MRRLGWFLLGLIVGGVVVGYTTRDAISRVQGVETRLTEVTSQLKGVEGTLAAIPPRLGDVRVKLQRIGTFIDPVDAAVRSDDDALYVATRPGRIYRLVEGSKPKIALDLSEQVDDIKARRGAGGEAGLLGMTFSPDNEFMYVTYTSRWRGQEEQSVIWTLDEFRTKDREADLSTRRTLLTVRKLKPHHNAGVLRFGPDGYLYTAIGDGSPSGDAYKTAQDPTDLLGSIIRIDPRPSGSKKYTVPKTNPFVGTGKGAPEVWAYGVRNPWRFSFDRVTGDLWVADVGDRKQEEINHIHASKGGGRGANLGWSLVEGNLEHGDPPERYTPPVHVLEHKDGYCAVIGGFVYRGSAIPALRGAFLHSDYCKGELRAVVDRGDRVTDHSLGVETENPSGFAEDGDGELYLIAIKGGVYRIAPA